MPSSGFQTCARSEEHTSELQSHDNLVCRLLLEKNSRPGRARAGQRGPIPATARRAEGRGGVAAGRWARCRPADRLFFNDTATPEIYPLSLHDALPINDTATTEIYTLSLHDALPISVVAVS